MRKLLSLPICASLLICACSKDPEVAKREFLANGDKYAAAGKDREAIVEYRNALQQDPRFGQARYKLAETHAKLGELQEAYPEYMRAADLLPDDKNAQLKAATMLLMARQFEDGRERADKVLELDPRNVQALILRANALAGLSKVDEALVEAEKAIAEDPSEGASYAALGAIQLGYGSSANAEKAFLRAVELDPKSLQARLALANYYWATKRVDDAVAQLKHAQEIDVDNVSVNRILAAVFVTRGQNAEAEPYLKAAATDDAGRLLLGDHYVRSGRTSDGRRIFETLAAGSGSQAGPAKLRLAALVKSSGDTASARQMVDEVLAKTPTDVDALVLKSRWLLETKELDKALDTAQNAVHAHPNSAPAQMALGAVRNARGETPEALTAYKEAARVDARTPRADIEVSNIALAAGRSDEALQFARSAVAKAPNSAAAHFAVARASLALKDTKTADPIVDQLTRIAPKTAPVLTLAGELEMAKGNTTAARASFEKARAADPSELMALIWLTRLDWREKRHDAAVMRVERALAERPKDTEILLLMAEAYNAAGQTAKVERPLRDVIQLDPSSSQAYGMLAVFYQQQGRVDESLRELDTALAQYPRALPALLLKGVLLQMTSRGPESIASYRKALEVNGGAVVALNNLAWYYAEKGENLDEALTMARTAKAQNPKSVDFTDTLGWVLYKKGLYDLAIDSFREALALSPNRGDVHYHLGLAYAGKGNVALARQTLLVALEHKLSASEAADARNVLKTLAG